MVLYSPPQPARELPVIDIAATAGNDDAACRATAWEIHKACRDTGFFYVAGHGVAEGLVAAQFDWARRFFALPMDVKAALHMKRSRSFAGYEPLAGQTLDAASPPDLKEGFYYTADLPEDDAYVVAGIRGYGGNQWPGDDLPGFDAAGFRRQMQAYHAAMRVLGDRLLSLLARSLDLAPDYFVPMYRKPNAVVRLLHYPPQPEAAQFNQLGAGAHTDWGGITLLAQDDAGGLEVQNTAGEWIVAPPLAGSFVINLGDLVQRWTNDLYRSNMHRVLNRAKVSRDRYSVPFFYTPDHFARIECLPGCSSAERPPRHAPCLAGEHMMEMFNRSYGRKAG
ncbi:2-oxoglutarate and iron-dependent oxygenase domain-containing protein [Ferrovibrio terrae]|uniref:isopenicillin N synthase family dioxygenase n=1 Tax=Ferrovibrio terrae TaxID=2594003 RepID=UPI003137BD56